MNRSNYKYRVYNGRIIKDILKNSKSYFLGFLFIIGILFGALFIKQGNETTFIITENIISKYMQMKSEQGIIQVFLNSATLNLVFTIINIFFGFSLIGYPLIIWLPFLRGLGLGVFSGYMYIFYKLSGLGYCAFLVYPGAVISAFAFILACCDSCDYSKNAYEKSIRAKGQFEKDETKIYLFRQFIYFAVCLCSSMIEAFFTIGFSRFFQI